MSLVAFCISCIFVMNFCISSGLGWPPEKSGRLLRISSWAACWIAWSFFWSSVILRVSATSLLRRKALAALLLQLELMEPLLLGGVQNVGDSLGLDVPHFLLERLALLVGHVLEVDALAGILHGLEHFLLLIELFDLRLGHVQLFLNVGRPQHHKTAAAEPAPATESAALAALTLSAGRGHQADSKHGRKHGR